MARAFCAGACRRRLRGRTSLRLVGSLIVMAVALGAIGYSLRHRWQASGGGADGPVRPSELSSGAEAKSPTSSTFASSPDARAAQTSSKSKTADVSSSKPGKCEGIIYGRTLFEDGRPAPHARVHIIESSSEYTSSTATGDFELVTRPRHNLQIAASLGPFISYLRENEAPYVELIAGRRCGPHNLFLRQGLALTGVVRSQETAQPIMGVNIHLFILTDSADVSSNCILATTQTTADGSFRMEGCPAGSVLLLLGAQGYADMIARTQISSGRKNQCDISLEPEGKVVARVSVTSGAALAGASLAFDSDHSFLELRHGGIKTDAKGTATIGGLARRAPPKIYARKEGYAMSGDGVRPLFPRGAQPAEIKLVMKPTEADSQNQPADSESKPFSKALAFTGLVTDVSSMPIFGASVCWMGANVPNGNEPALAGADGHYRLEKKIGIEKEPDPKKLDQFLKTQGQNRSLIAFAKGYVPAVHRGIAPGTADAPREVNFALETGHWAGGQVVNSKLEPIPGVEISFQSLGKTPDLPQPHELPDWRPLRTAADGKFHIENLPNAKLAVSLSAKGWSTEKDRIIPLDQETQIVMRSGAVIKGRVEDKETGAPIRNFRIHYDGPQHSEDRSLIGTLFTSDEGRFTLEDLEQDACYVVGIVAQGYVTGFDIDVVAQEETKAKERIFKISRGTDLAGIVIDSATQKPVERARLMYACSFLVSLAGDDILLRAGDDNIPDLPGFLQKAATGPDGAFSFKESDELGALGVVAEGYTPLVVRPNERAKYGSAGSLRIVLGAGGSVSGVVTFDSKPLGNAQVSISFHEDENNVFRQRKIDNNNRSTPPDGTYRFENLEAGPYDMSITNQAKDFTIASRRVFTLSANEQKTFNVEIKKGPGALSGHVFNGGASVVGATISIGQKIIPDAIGDSFTFQPRSDAQGAYRIEGMNEAKYNASANGKVAGKVVDCKAEEIEIKGETQHDFQMNAAFKVTLRLVMGGAGESDKAPQLRQATLELRDADRAPYSKDRDDIRSAQKLENARAIFAGRFKGDYLLTVSGQTPGGSSFSVKNIGPLALDNLAADQDLGDLAVPALGDASLKGTVMDSLGKPLQNASVDLASEGIPGNPVMTINARSDIEGHYEISGLKEGVYYASASAKKDSSFSLGGNDNRLEVTEKIEIAGAATHDFILMSGAKVTVRFILSQKSSAYCLSDFQKAAIYLIGGDKPNTENPLQINNGAESTIFQRTSQFNGRFLGRYGLLLEYADKQIQLPQVLSLDNMEHDQDAGEILIPDMGALRIAIMYPPSELKRAKKITALADSAVDAAGSGAQSANKDAGPSFSLNPEKAVEPIGPFFEGAHRIAILAPGWISAPPVATVMIKSGETPTLRFTLTPVPASPLN